MIPNDLLRHLRDHLNLEMICHRTLLNLAEQQLQALVAHRIREFSDLNEQLTPHLTDQQRLRRERELLMTRIETHLDADGKRMSLSRIIQASPEPFHGELKSRQIVLRETLQKLRTTEERKQALIRQGLGLMRDLVSALTGENAPNAYDRRGQSGSGIGHGRLVNIAG